MATEMTNAEAMIASGDTSEPWPVYKQYFDLLARQPNIPFEKLKGVAAPTLVMAGDRDEIRDEHTLEIFHALPKAHLCIFPGATHLIPWENPVLLNQTVDKFFREPFTRPDTKENSWVPRINPDTDAGNDNGCGAHDLAAPVILNRFGGKT